MKWFAASHLLRALAQELTKALYDRTVAENIALLGLHVSQTAIVLVGVFVERFGLESVGCHEV